MEEFLNKGNDTGFTLSDMMLCTAMTDLHAAHRPAVLLSLTALCLALCLGAAPSLAQTQTGDDTEEDSRENPYGTGAGFYILLTNNGFGMGAYYRRELSARVSFLAETSLGAGKDERELKFLSRYGSGFILNKRNYFLMLPVQLGIQRRLFSENIEDNFRPYLHVSGGPAFGWEYPYFDDENGNDRFDENIDRRLDLFSAFPRGQLHFGLSGMVAFGAYFGFSQKVTQGVRLGYAINYFFDGIQLLEPDIKDAQHLFHSPIISITFGKLF